MLVTVISKALNIQSVDTVKVKAIQLPWKGNVALVANTAHYNADGELVFNVVCNNKSPEPGRVYCVYATVRNSWAGALDITHTAQVVAYNC